MHFIEEEDLLFADIRKDGSQITFDLQDRSGSLLIIGSHFVGDNGGQRGLAKSGWTVEQNVIQSLAARPRRLNRDCKIFFNLLLSDEISFRYMSTISFHRAVLDRTKCV